MEDNIQTIVVVVISVFLLFIFPVYMAYEKKDDISYALAMRYTQDLVEEVRDKGYITKYMYEDYRARLKVTGNSYDIALTHEYNRYDPITNYYKVEDGKYILVKTSTREEKAKYEEELLQQGIESNLISEGASKEEISNYIMNQYNAAGVDKVEDTYQLSKQVYTTDHILNVLNSEKKLLLNSDGQTVSCSDDSNADDGCQYAYIMNVDDNFNVTIKNTNTTLATVIYNMVTANTLDKNTRIYVNYGGAILSSKWYGNIDYTKMDHDRITLDKYTAANIFTDERKYMAESQPTEVAYIDGYTEDYNDEYAIEFEVKPNDVTVLREKGNNNGTANQIAYYTGYNFAVGNNKSQNNKSSLSASVGFNGITLVTNVSENLVAVTTAYATLPTYSYTEYVPCTKQEEYTYIDEETGIEKTGIRDVQTTCPDIKQAQRKMTDYSKMILTYNSKGKIKVALTGKSGIENTTLYINVKDDNDLLKALQVSPITIDSPTENTTLQFTRGDMATRGTNIKISVKLTKYNINISANKLISNEMTILSYPMSIKDYIKVKIEVKANDAGKYIAILYIDGEKIEESIEMDVIPKVSVIGKTFIGNEERFFNGSIKNVKVYYYKR